MNKTGIVFLGIVFITAWTGLIIYNFISNDRFFEASASSLITMFIALVVSYFFVQRKTDIRRKYDKVDAILDRIQIYVNDGTCILGGEEFGRRNLLVQRTIANKIKLLKDYNLNRECLAEIDKMQKHFQKYQETYGEYYLSQKKLEDRVSDMQNHLFLIDKSCDKMHLLLS